MLSIHIAENASIARTNSMNREDVSTFFEDSKKAMVDQDLFNKPAEIYIMDKTGFQLKKEVRKVVAKNGSKHVHYITSTEKGGKLLRCCLL